MITDEEREAICDASDRAMGRLNEFINGLTVLAKYSTYQYCVSADHDIIYFDANPEKVTDTDLRYLAAMGWSWGGEESHGFYKFT